MISKDPSFAYYMLPTRAFQLLTGAMCYFISINALPRLSPKLHQVLGLLGAIAIALSFWLVNETVRYPGINALPVTFGTGFVILAGVSNTGLITKILSQRALVQIGLISYSLYLWHWPVIKFAKYLAGDLTDAQKLLCLGIVFILSWMSYIFVEEPFRRYSGRFTKVFTQQFIFPTLATLMIAGFFLTTNGFGIYGFADGYKRQIQAMKVNPMPASRFEYVCQSSRLTIKDTLNPNCVIGGSSEPPIVLWGDSNAAHYVGILGEISEQYHFSFRNYALSSCPPVFNQPGRFTTGKWVERCNTGSKIAIESLKKFDVVVMAAVWSAHTRKKGFLLALDETIKTLEADGKAVIVLGVVPRFPELDRECGMKSVKVPFINCFDKSVVSRKAVDRTNTIIKETVVNAGADYFDVSDILCNEKECSSYIDNVPAYFNDGHLSMSGSIAIGKVAKNTQQAQSIFSKLGVKPEDNPKQLPWE
jgi:hypothetical protein